MQLQTLSAPANVLEASTILMGDNAATVLLDSWDVTAIKYDDQAASGPIPIYFAKDVEGMSRGLMENLQTVLKSHKEIMKR